MKASFLFPNNWRPAGIVLVAIGIVLYIFSVNDYFDNLDNYLKLHPFIIKLNAGIISNDIICLALIAGLMLIGFSKEKVEDEQIAQLRSVSLQWAMYINYGILVVLILTINGFDFFNVVVYNVFTPIAFFIIRFRWKIYLLNRSLKQVEEIA